MKVNSLEVMEKIANQLIEGDMMNPPAMPKMQEEDVAGAQLANLLQQEAQLKANEAQGVLSAEPLAQHQVTHGAPEEVIESAAAEVAEVVKAQIVADGVQEELAEQAGIESALEQQMLPPTEEELPPTEEELPPTEEELLEEQVAAAISEELVKHANVMYELGTVAKLIECATGAQGDELQKIACDILAEASSNSEAYYTNVEKVASELFESEQARAELFSVDGLLYLEEQLAYLNDDTFEKLADDTGGIFSNFKQVAGNALNTAKNKVVDAVTAVTDLKDVGAQIEQTRAELNAIIPETDSFKVPDPHMNEIYDRRVLLNNQLDELGRRQTLGRRALGGAVGLGVAGATYGANQAYNHFANNQNDEPLLPHEKTSGTLEKENEKNGGTGKMSKQLVQDFLKVAGVAGLVSIANNETFDMNLRKEASDTLDTIAKLSHENMTEELVKVATQIYSEQELHEIVANKHTPALLDKVAYFLHAHEASIEELEKTASASGVAAAKNVGAGLADAASNITATIDAEKASAEGAGREYVGDLDSTGLAGGGLVGGTEGYGVLNEPGKYDVEQTASYLEEAYLHKQAAARAYVEADNVIRAILSK